MKKLYFALSIDSIENSTKFYIADKWGDSELFSRTSPIFLLNENSYDYKKITKGSFILLYTLDTYYSLSRIQRLIDNKKSSSLLFMTLGLASILLYIPNEEELYLLEQILIDIGDNIFSHEVWNIHDSIIEKDNNSSNIKKFKNVNPIEINVFGLDLEDVAILNEIKPTFDFFYSFTNSYIPQYKDFAEELRTTILEISYGLSFLTDCIDETKYRFYLNEFICDPVYIDKAINNYNITKKDYKSAKTRKFQLRDELMQISAVLRTINNQALYGLECFGESYSKSGYNSVFGLGLAYSSIFSMYIHVRHIFGSKINRTKIEKYFDESKISSKAGVLSTDEAYKNWKQEFESNDYGIENCLEDHNLRRSPYHLIYFSNRLGFRETKRAISFAKQVITLSILPAWTLNTFTHEFVHSFVRDFMSLFYPYSFPDLSEIDDKIHELYKYYTNNTKTGKKTMSLANYLKVNILRVIHQLYCLNNHNVSDINIRDFTSVLKKPKVIKYLKDFHGYLNEIVVDLLDFKYFYNSDSELYVKSIWSSWLGLPVTTSRLHEYIMRTLVVVGSQTEKSSRTERFNYSIKLIKTQINHLRDYYFVDNHQIETVIQKLNEDSFIDELRFEYISIWIMFSDVIVKCFYSPTIRNHIRIDDESILGNDSSYDFKINEFSERRISNPLGLLKYISDFVFENYSKIQQNSDVIESQTAWLLSLLSSKLFKE